MTLENITECPVCGHSRFTPFLKAKDQTVSQQSFQIVACAKCGFLFTNPRPPASEIGKYYESAEYISHNDQSRDLMSRVYTGVRNYTTRQKINLLQQAVPKKGKLLDVGCGTGFFLSKAKGAGWQAHGTEPDAQARSVAIGRVGENVYETIRAPFLESQTYDAITMWHVLEHVHLLSETMEWLHKQLAPQGKLFIAVPNPESEDARQFQENWAAYDVPRHLYHFSKKALKDLAEAHRFKVEQILPMWFDAYYVSMLSTRYQEGTTNLPASLWKGTLSNWRGRKSTDQAYNTSSLIYVLSRS
jgi:2-polyprenyl-3-methyl-5-hydroxy-6-metoxy-1,4-benzoquinol methylase